MRCFALRWLYKHHLEPQRFANLLFRRKWLVFADIASAYGPRRVFRKRPLVFQFSIDFDQPGFKLVPSAFIDIRLASLSSGLDILFAQSVDGI